MESTKNQDKLSSKISLRESDLFQAKQQTNHPAQSESQSNQYSFFDMKHSTRGGDGNVIFNTIVNINKYTIKDDKNCYKDKEFAFHDKNVASMSF